MFQRFLAAVLVTWGVVHGATARAEGPGSDVAIMPFDQRALDSSLSDSLTDAFQFEFSRALGRPVLGQQDLVNLIGLEKQKELLGCDAGSCAAEIGGALGVRYVVFGRFAKVGQTFLVTVKFMDAPAAKLLATDQESIRVAGDKDAREQALLEGVQRLAQRLGAAMAPIVGGAPVPPKAPPATAKPAPKTAAKPAPAPPTRTSEPRASGTRRLVPKQEGGLGNRPWIVALAAAPVSCLCVAPSCFLPAALAFLVGLGVDSQSGQGVGFVLSLPGILCAVVGLGAVATGFAALPLAGFLFAKRTGNTVMVEAADNPEDGVESAAPARKNKGATKTGDRQGAAPQASEPAPAPVAQPPPAQPAQPAPAASPPTQPAQPTPAPASKTAPTPPPTKPGSAPAKQPAAEDKAPKDPAPEANPWEDVMPKADPEEDEDEDDEPQKKKGKKKKSRDR